MKIERCSCEEALNLRAALQAALGDVELSAALALASHRLAEYRELKSHARIYRAALANESVSDTASSAE